MASADFLHKFPPQFTGGDTGEAESHIRILPLTQTDRASAGTV